MTNLKKLGVLLKVSKAAEHETIRIKKEIEDVVLERQDRLKEVESKRTILEEQLFVLTNKNLKRAVTSGDIAQISSIASYELRLRGELERIEERIKVKAEEVNRALERASIAEHELLEASIEKKKYEQLISKVRKNRAIHDYAKEEIEIDEMGSRKKN
jgi:hypothetical protein